jgi:integrase
MKNLGHNKLARRKPSLQVWPSYDLGQAVSRSSDKSWAFRTLVVLYCGRHDYGTRVLRETGNLAAVMKMMGHRDVKTVMQYQHPEMEIVR